MQEREKEQEQAFVPADPNSQPLAPVSVLQIDAQDDDPDEIFLNAVAEIDTQPLVKIRKPLVINFIDLVQLFFCSSLILCGMVGMVWQAITYPYTLVILYTVEKPASITTTLDVPTRTLAPVTLTRSLTIPTTGTGHLDARAATGTLTFYNGKLSSQVIAGGTVFTGQDGIKIATNQTITIPAANPPQEGEANITASALNAGSQGNIATDDISIALTSDLLVRNLASFTGGRDARTYKAVAAQDIQQTISTLQATIARAFPLAFPLARGERAYPLRCVTTQNPSNKPGDEASTVTVRVMQTCAAVAYRQSQLQAVATQLFTTQTKPGAQYKLVGSLTAKVVSVTPLTVDLTGSWAYVLSSDDEQSLAQAIQGDTPAQARTYLLSTGVISSASVPSTLPPAMYISFLVLVG